jgi:5-methylcytosine-specific restriction endonuclease McrA
VKVCRNGHSYLPGKRRGCGECAKARAVEYRKERDADPKRLDAKRKLAREYKRAKYASDPAFRAQDKKLTARSLKKRRALDPTVAIREKEYQRKWHQRRKEAPGFSEKQRLQTQLRRQDAAYARRERERAIAADRARNADPEFKARKAAYMRDRFRRTAVRELHRKNNHKRRATVAGTASPGVTPSEWAAIKKAYELPDGSEACAYCRKACRPTIDHVIPIARGGVDAAHNVVPACKACNCSKRDRLLSEWHRAPSNFVLKHTG